jgi:hypothetical protein
MGFSGAIGQLAGCNLSLDLCAVKSFNVLFLLAGPAVGRYAKLPTGIAFNNRLTQGPILSRNERQVFYFKGGWLATMSKKRLN